MQRGSRYQSRGQDLLLPCYEATRLVRGDVVVPEFTFYYKKSFTRCDKAPYPSDLVIVDADLA